MPDVAVVLWQIEVSLYSEKARWALDHKGIAYESRVPMPGFHRLSALAATRGRHARLPVLELEGRRIGDSTAIIAALEEHHPEPALYPEAAAERERALALEDWFDEELGPYARRFVWHHTLPDTELVARTLFSRPSPTRERLLRASAPLARLAVRRDYGVSGEAADRGRDAVRAAMDRLESELGPSGYLVGDRFTVADLAAASLFTPLLCPSERPFAPAAVAPAVGELRDELMARPGGAWVAQMYALHRNQEVTREPHALSH